MSHLNTENSLKEACFSSPHFNFKNSFYKIELLQEHLITISDRNDDLSGKCNCLIVS